MNAYLHLSQLLLGNHTKFSCSLPKSRMLGKRIYSNRQMRIVSSLLLETMN